MSATEVAAASDSMDEQWRGWCSVRGVYNRRWPSQTDYAPSSHARVMPARHKQIGERAGHDQAMSVLFEAAIAHLGKTEHPLDDPDRMLDPRFREGRPLARTLDLVRFLVRSLSSTTRR
jgi:hypothetical protein